MVNDDRIKLRTLLGYWIKHNEEHSQEFKQWAAKAKGFGEAKVGEDIVRAAQELDKASEILAQVLSRLEARRG